MSNNTLALNQINIVVRDMRASVDFYRRLGVDMPESAGTDEPAPFHVNGEAAGGFQVDFDTPDFAQVWNTGWAGRTDLGGRVVIGFEVAMRTEVDRLSKELTDAGHTGLQAPFDAFWGARYAVVEDPNGIAVGLMSPIDPELKYWPPENWKA
jgi:catechol 2,3-dioxygenase-like lactoylglutathione lyase family enzyme